jgi:alanine racemase
MSEAVPADGATHLRPAWAEVDLDAIGGNVRRLVALAAPAEVCAVVKADGYGHGAVAVARAALAAGASWLAVALPAEGSLLRGEGIEAPILLLSEPDSWEETLRHRLTPTVHRAESIGALAAAVEAAGGPPVGVHLKVDTGMHRIGCAPEVALERAKAIVASTGLRLDAVYTHFPVADEPDNPFTPAQSALFDSVVAELRAAGLGDFRVHAANSAATLVHPDLRHDLVRCGIAVYGLEPSPALRGVGGLTPALSLKARVSHVQRIPAGVAVSYGLRRPAPVDTVVATVPLGYADGVPRRLSEVGAEVLVGGRRCPLAGNVTMDQILVDCGPGAEVEVGDEVVLLGRQGHEEVPVSDWADRLGTITYEITCGISPRVPRVYVSRTISG